MGDRASESCPSSTCAICCILDQSQHPRARLGLLGSTEGEERNGAIVERIGVVRLDRERLVEARQCVLGPLEGKERVAATVERLEIVAPDPERLIEACQGLLGPLEI